MRYVSRSLREKLRLYLATFPAVLIMGPRQCGKSTFVTHELESYDRFDLERPADYDLITADPELFLSEHTGPLCIDEAQRYPQLFAVLRYMIDKKRLNGRYVLLGSAGPSIMTDASESLAGRLGILELSPFMANELAPEFEWRQRWFWGGLPPLYNLTRNEQRRVWLDSYIAAFLERDLPLLGVRVPAARLRRFWTMLNHVHGQILDVSSLARSLELSTTAINRYLDILEGALMIQRIQPYFANIKKRLVKRPKVYFRDTGILHRLAGLRTEPDLETWIGRGSSFEGLVVEEIKNLACSAIETPRFYFWRTGAGAEVDLLIDVGSRLIPIEIKLGTAVSRHNLAGLRQCMKDLGLDKGYIITRSEREEALGQGIRSIPWTDVLNKHKLPWEL